MTTEGRRPSLSTCPAGPCWAGVADGLRPIPRPRQSCPPRLLCRISAGIQTSAGVRRRRSCREQAVAAGAPRARGLRGGGGEGPLQGRAPWPLRHFLVSSRRVSSLPPHPTPAPHILPAASPLRPVLPASWQPLCPSRDPVFPGRWCPGRLRPSPLPGTLGGLASAASGLSGRPGLCPQPSLSAHSPQVCLPWVLVAAIPGPCILGVSTSPQCECGHSSGTHRADLTGHSPYFPAALPGPGQDRGWP